MKKKQNIDWKSVKEYISFSDEQGGRNVAHLRNKGFTQREAARILGEPIEKLDFYEHCYNARNQLATCEAEQTRAAMESVLSDHDRLRWWQWRRRRQVERRAVGILRRLFAGLR